MRGTEGHTEHGQTWGSVDDRGGPVAMVTVGGGVGTGEGSYKRLANV